MTIHMGIFQLEIELYLRTNVINLFQIIGNFIRFKFIICKSASTHEIIRNDIRPLCNSIWWHMYLFCEGKRDTMRIEMDESREVKKHNAKQNYFVFWCGDIERLIFWSIWEREKNGRRQFPHFPSQHFNFEHVEPDSVLCIVCLYMWTHHVNCRSSVYLSKYLLKASE